MTRLPLFRSGIAVPSPCPTPRPNPSDEGEQSAQSCRLRGGFGLSVSIVVPCYRSARTLPALVTRLHAVMASATVPYEIILVVDGSPDDTWSVAQSLAAPDPANDHDGPV